MIDRVGQQLGNYRLIRLLGKGSFGEVYLATHVYLQKPAAIKVLRDQLAETDLENFLEEARTIANLEHPGIVRVLDFGIDGSTPFLAMSYAAQGTLRQRHANDSRLPLPLVISYVKQIASALDYAHARKVIHRDIKPENMLLGANSDVLLSDFGIALVSHSSRYQSTQEVVGTVSYMAPEQLQGKPSAASDQYALGIVAYEWLCGERPFHGSFIELFSQHCFVPPPPLRSINSAISPNVELAVLQALAKSPLERFANVTEFAVALEQADSPDFQTYISSRKGVVPLPPTIPATPLSPVQPLSQPLFPSLTRPLSSHPDFTTGSPTPTTIQQPSNGSLNQPNQPSQPVGLVLPPEERQGISRRTVLVGLSGLAVVGLAGGGFWYVSRSTRGVTANTLGTQTPSASPAVTGTATPKHSATPTHRSTPAPAHPSPTTTRTAQTPSPTPTTGTTPTQQPTPTTPTTPTTPPPLGTTLYSYTGHTGGIRVLQWSPDGQRIASGSNDSTAQVWNAFSGANPVIYRGHSSYVEGVAWSPDGSKVASGSADTTVQIWNPSTGIGIYTYTGHSLWVNRISWSPNGQYIASGEQASKAGVVVQVRVWQSMSGNTPVIYQGHTNGVFSVAWSPDGTRIASCGYDYTLQIWEALTGNHIATFNPGVPLYGLSWSPDGTRVAVGGNASFGWLVNAASGNAVGNFNASAKQIADVAWSPDGTSIVAGTVGSGQGDVLYNYSTGAPPYRYAQSGNIDAVGWSSNSQYIASGSDANVVQVWQA